MEGKKLDQENGAGEKLVIDIRKTVGQGYK